MFDDFIKLVREIHKTKEFIPLHAPVFVGNEKNTSMMLLIALMFQA